jgi:uncharacterized sulfatase
MRANWTQGTATASRLAAQGTATAGYGDGVPPSLRRHHIICENHHNPTTFHCETLVTDQHKITVYAMADYGELYDLAADPTELTNLWDDPASLPLKTRLLHEFVRARLQAHPTPMPRIFGA